MTTPEAALAEFNKKVIAFASIQVPAQVVIFHKKITLEVLRRLILRTPVDTGRAI